MIFSEAATIAVGDASTNIAEMIEELTQPKGLEVPIIDVGGASTSMVDEAERLSLPVYSREDLRSSIPQPGEIEELQFATLVLRVFTNTVAVATRDLAPTQTTELIGSAGVKDNSITASVGILWWRSPPLKLSWHMTLLPLQHTAAQLVLNNLRAEQKCLHEEAEKEIAEQTRRLDEARACYQNLSVDL